MAPNYPNKVEQVGVPYVRQFPKIGRNEECPCGSGKKFKRCCASKPDTDLAALFEESEELMDTPEEVVARIDDHDSRGLPADYNPYPGDLTDVG